MGLAKKDDSTSQHPMYYKENNTPLRETKFYLKPVQATAGKGKWKIKIYTPINIYSKKFEYL